MRLLLDLNDNSLVKYGFELDQKLLDILLHGDDDELTQALNKARTVDRKVNDW